MDVDSDLNPWIILQGLTKNPVNNVIEKGSGEYTSSLNTATNLKGYQITFICLDFHLSGREVGLNGPQEFGGITSALIIRHIDH